jgi:hypothetical protein
MLSAGYSQQPKAQKTLVLGSLLPLGTKTGLEIQKVG